MQGTIYTIAFGIGRVGITTAYITRSTFVLRNFKLRKEWLSVHPYINSHDSPEAEMALKRLVSD